MHDEFGNTRVIHGVTHCCLGGSKSTTTNQYVGSQRQAMGLAGREMKELLPNLAGQINQGLSPLEKSYYSGQVQKGVAENTAAATTGFSDSMARLGNNVGRGAEVEGKADIARGGVQGTAQGLSNVQGMDISKKQQNFKNLLAAMGLAYSPNATGSSSSSSPGLLATLGAII